MDKVSKRTYKVKVRQEYEVEIYYQEGIIADDLDEALDIVLDECVNLAFEEEGLVARLHDQTETSNGYLANIITQEPTVEIIYSVDGCSANMAKELSKRGIHHD